MKKEYEYTNIKGVKINGEPFKTHEQVRAEKLKKKSPSKKKSDETKK